MVTNPVGDLVHSATAPAASVTAGGAVSAGSGLNIARSLCYSTPGASTGTFSCGGTLSLGVPFDTPAATYTAVLTITLT